MKINYRKIKTVLLVLLVIAGSAGVAYFLRPNDSKRIQKQFEKLCLSVEKSSDENPTAGAFKTLSFSYMCTDSVRIDLRGAPFQGEMSAEELTSHLARGRGMCESIAITPLECEVELTTPTRANAICVVRVKINALGSAYDEIRHFQARWQKIDKSWKITAVADDDILVK